MTLYRKTALIEAHQWFADGDHSAVAVLRDPETQAQIPFPETGGKLTCSHDERPFTEHGWVHTLEGGHIVCPGDWIATGPQGEHWPIKPEIFAATYEAVPTIDEVDPDEQSSPRVVPTTAEDFPSSNAGTKSGISLAWFGEEGEWAVAFGHLKQPDFAAAVDEHEDTESDPAEVQHLWAVTEIDDSLPEDHDFHQVIRWEGVTSLTVHSFPVTVLNTPS